MEYVAAALIAWLVVKEVREFLRESDCNERVEAAKRAARREAMADYRSTYNQAIKEAKEDVSKDS